MSCFRVASNGWQLGAANEAKGIVHNIHSTQFDIDENALAVGTGFTSYLTYKYLNEED